MANFPKSVFLQQAKGFFLRRKNCPKIMIPAVHRKWQRQYIGRKEKKRTVRQQWIEKIDAGTREHKFYYDDFIRGLNRSNINLNRKILSDLAEWEPYSFKAVVDEINFIKRRYDF